MIGTLDLQTQKIKNFFFPFDTQEIQEYINDYEEVIGHNLIAFDVPVLKRLVGLSFDSVHLLDTLLLSRLDDPSREGGHSLGAWGERLKFPKGDHNDWTKLSEEMIEYCEQDLRVTYELLKHLEGKLEKFGTTSVELEHDVQRIISQQVENGWLLNQQKAFELLAKLKERKIQLEDEVHKVFIPLPTFVSDVVPKVTKSGKFSKTQIKFLGDNWVNVGGNLSRIDFPEFNLGSRKQIGEYLKHFGWKPKDFTEKGQPIVDEKVLEGVTDIPEAQMIAEFLLIQKRMAQVQSWIEAVKDDGRVHGQVNTIGAVTGRMTHSSPNVAQVPASKRDKKTGELIWGAKGKWGTDCRACWTVPKETKLVGCDASGLELRMLAHYMDDKDYTHEILNGDIHTANQKAAGLDSRDNAKTFIYAFLYGAGDAKIGSIVGGSAKAGRSLKEQFLSNTPALADLRERVEHACARGYLRGLDGRKLIIRSPHAALNTLLQSAGAIIMKKSLTILDKYATMNNISYRFVGNIHDEMQTEVPKDQAEKFGWLAVECIKAAGIEFNMRCPLDGEYKVGDTWAETH